MLAPELTETDPVGLIDPFEPAEAVMVYVFAATNDADTVQFVVIGLVV